MPNPRNKRQNPPSRNLLAPLISEILQTLFQTFQTFLQHLRAITTTTKIIYETTDVRVGCSWMCKTVEAVVTPRIKYIFPLEVEDKDADAWQHPDSDDASHCRPEVESLRVMVGSVLGIVSALLSVSKKGLKTAERVGFGRKCEIAWSLDGHHLCARGLRYVTLTLFFH